jgi:arylsulfatase A-like enzyme
MERFRFLTSAGMIALAVAAGNPALAVGGQPENQKAPNILFIMTDQQHAGMMSSTGNEWLSTPALDSLSREGVRFERAYVANPVCVPSRISMATGVMPGRLGVFGNGMQANVPDEVGRNSLGKLMKRAGYDTFYGGKVHMCDELSPPGAGYDEFHRDSRGTLSEACVEFIKRRRDGPFFAVASFINPHDICYAHSAYKGQVPRSMRHVQELYRQASLLPLDRLPPVPGNYAIPRHEPDSIEAHLNPGAVTPAITMREIYDERDWQINRWIYGRLTEQVDGHIGRILDALRESGQEEETIILFTSDHGNMDASHRLASKGLFYEESVRVPFLIKYQGRVPAGRVDDQHLVSTGLDILPTLCDYAGVAVPKTLLGRSLRPIAEDRQVEDWRPYVASENSWGRMIRSDRYKYCVYDSGSVRESLVDMETDPGEMNNLATSSEFREALERHRRYLDQWIEESGDAEARLLAGGVAE